MKRALKHYEEASNAIHHFNSDIPKAIKAYYGQRSELPDKEFESLTKEEVIQIYKNCRKMLQEIISNKPMLTDEEIEKQFPILSSHQMDTDSWNNRLRQEGARWYRNKIQERIK